MTFREDAENLPTRRHEVKDITHIGKAFPITEVLESDRCNLHAPKGRRWLGRHDKSDVIDLNP